MSEEEVDIEGDLKTEADVENDHFWKGYAMAIAVLFEYLDPKKKPKTRQSIKTVYKNILQADRFHAMVRAHGYRPSDPRLVAIMKTHPILQHLLFMIGEDDNSQPAGPRLSTDVDLSNILDYMDDEQGPYVAPVGLEEEEQQLTLAEAKKAIEGRTYEQAEATINLMLQHNQIAAGTADDLRAITKHERDKHRSQSRNERSKRKRLGDLTGGEVKGSIEIIVNQDPPTFDQPSTTRLAQQLRDYFD